MEPGSDQYVYSGNNQLYFYADYRRSMCCFLNAKCYDLHAGYANFQWDRTTLSELCSTCFASNFKRRNQRNLEPGSDQYTDSRSNQLYIYSGYRRSMRCSLNAKCYDHCTGCANLQWDRTTLSELGSSCFASNFQRRNQRNMEPGDNKYCNYWNNQLYFYADHRKCMCCSNHGGHYDHQAGYTNLQWDRTAVSELYSSCFACNFQGRNQRNLEPGSDQHGNCRNNQLYIYSNHQRSMCCSLNIKCYDHCTGCTNFQWDRTTLSKRNGTCTSCHIEGRDQRNLEPGGDQYIDSRNNQLYIYSDHRQCMFCSSHREHYDLQAGCTYLQWDRTTVSELHSSCFTCNFQRRNQRHLEPGDNKYCNYRNNQLYFYTDHQQYMFCSGHAKCYDLNTGYTNF